MDNSKTGHTNLLLNFVAFVCQLECTK